MIASLEDNVLLHSHTDDIYLRIKPKENKSEPVNLVLVEVLEFLIM